MGGEFVGVAWIRHEGTFDMIIAEKTVVDFNKFGQKLKENGLTFCYHNHGFEFVRNGKETFFDYIVKNTKLEYASFEMDILQVFHHGQHPTKL